MTRRSAVGGAAGEAGSIYRAAVGANMLASGLVGNSVRLIEDGPGNPPAAVRVEADQGVDDLVLEFKDESRLLVQAKSRVGNDRHLRDSVEQWAISYRDGAIGANDRVLVVAKQLKGEARDISSALSRNRRAITQDPSPSERKALATLTALCARYGLSGEGLDYVLDRAHLVEVSEDTLIREAEYMLEGTVVRPGYGSAATTELSAHVRKLGASRSGSSLEEWISVIRDAGIVILDDPDRSVAAAHQADLVIINEYRSECAAAQDEIDLAGLVDDIPPMQIDNLISDFHVTTAPGLEDGKRDVDRNVSLIAVARRWRQFCLTGLPGSGKSTALRQLAAHWAKNDDAPLPIIIELRQVARLCQESTGHPTLHQVIANAADKFGIAGKRLVELLIEEAARGHACLLFDGLDECGTMKGNVTGFIEKVKSEHGPELRLLVSGRASATNSLERLGLPVVDLSIPSGLCSNLEDLVRHIGRHRYGLNSADPWVAIRLAWIDERSGLDSRLWDIPLLANLAVILICSKGDEAPLDSRAAVLYGAIMKSIDDWEDKKPRHSERCLFRTSLNKQKTTHSFKIIGRALVEGVFAFEGIKQALTSSFESAEWGLSRMDARTLAEDSLTFWDVLAGVYVTDHQRDTLQPRSQLFAELADAMTAFDESNEELRFRWLKDRAGRLDHHESVRLALQLDQSLCDQLGNVAVNSEGWLELELAAALYLDGTQFSDSVLRKILDRLMVAYQSSAPLHADKWHRSSSSPLLSRMNADYRLDPRWTWLLVYCEMSARNNRVARDSLVMSLSDESDRIVARASSVLADVELDRRQPNEAEKLALAQLFTLRLPEEPELTGTKEFKIVDSIVSIPRGTVKLRQGHAEAVRKCIDVLELSPEQVEYARYLTVKASYIDSHSIINALSSKGLIAREVALASTGQALDFVQDTSRQDKEWASFLALVGELNSELSGSDLSACERWAVEDLAALIACLTIGSWPVSGMGRALKDPKAFSEILRVYAATYRIDLRKVAAEARVLIAAGASRRELASFFYCPPWPLERLDGEQLALSDQTQAILVLTIETGDENLGRLAANLLVSHRCSDATRYFSDLLSECLTDRRARAAWAFLELERSALEFVDVWLDSDDTILRIGAARYKASRYVKEHQSLDVVAATEALDALLNDPDLCVRRATTNVLREVDADFPIREVADCDYWGCESCANQNDLNFKICGKCGSRLAR